MTTAAPPLVLSRATVVDGSGAPAFDADVRMAEGRITDVASPGSLGNEATLDCHGLLLTPGFIDIHSHSDLTLLLDPRARSAVHQGVTLEVIGNCGHGCAPLRDIAAARNAIYGPIPSDGFFGWRSMAGYLERLEQARPAINVVALVPNGQLRLSQLGLQQRATTLEEARAMAGALEEALEAGAHGFSTGLEYAQESATTADEVDALCRIVARRGGLYATHTRDRDRHALQAIDEALVTAERTGVRLQISHITPRSGLPGTLAALERVDAALARGLDLGFDMHTRMFGFTHLKNLLPIDLQQGTPGEIHRRLGDAQVLERVRAHPNLITGVGDWSRVVLVDSVAMAPYNGMDFAAIGQRMCLAPWDAALAVLRADVEHLQKPMVLLKTYTEDMLRSTYQHPGCMPGSDATTLAPDGPLAGEVFHGAYTWASWFLRRMVRETRALALEDAVHRMTALPAERLGLSDRGRIRPGAWADIALLDWPRYTDRGTVDAPSRLAEGVVHLFVNGVATIADGHPTGAHAGQLLRH